MIYIRKRNGSVEKFDKDKIKQAVLKAGGSDKVATKVSQNVNYLLLKRCQDSRASVYEIESLVIVELVNTNKQKVANSYREYKDSRIKERDYSKLMTGVMDILANKNEEVSNENSNKFAERLVTQRDLVAGELSKSVYTDNMIPKHLAEADADGLIHIHDKDYLAHRMYNCCLVDLDGCIMEGTVMNNVRVAPQTDFMTACTVATQITAGVSANQFGGQSWSTLPLAKVLRKHEEKLLRKYADSKYDVLRDELIEKELSYALRSGIQTINYQLNTLGASANQSPFVTIFMYVSEDVEYEDEQLKIISEIIRQRRDGVENEDGHNISLAFPKLILVLEDRFFDGSTSKFDELIDLSAQCVSKRLVPDFISEKKAKELFEGQVVAPMGKISA